jgi:hypothetical protein
MRRSYMTRPFDIVSLRCVGHEFPCKQRYRGQAEWRFVKFGKHYGWMCPNCGKKMAETLLGPGLPKPALLHEGPIKCGINEFPKTSRPSPPKGQGLR